MRWLVLALVASFAGCADPGFGVSYSDTEPGPGAHAPYGGDGTIDMVVAYFSFEVRGDGLGGDMGAHCGFDDWTLSPPSALVHIGNEPKPKGIVMREIHPDQSTDGIGHFGTAPRALWGDGHDAIKRSFDSEVELGRVTFHGDSASFEGIEVPSERWLLTEFRYSVQSGDGTWQVKETLHMRYFDDVPVELDRRQLMCD